MTVNERIAFFYEKHLKMTALAFARSYSSIIVLFSCICLCKPNTRRYVFDVYCYSSSAIAANSSATLIDRQANKNSISLSYA